MEVWQELRELLLVELAEWLGSYAFSTSTGEKVTEAIAVVPPNLPQDRRVTGLEVIIWKSPTRYQQEALSNREFYSQRTFSVFLIQHDQAQTTEAAVNKLRSLFPQIRVTPIPLSDRSDEQVKLEMTEFPKKLKRRFYE